MTKNTKRSITYPSAHDAALRRIAARDMCTVVALIRQAIKRLIAARDKSGGIPINALAWSIVINVFLATAIVYLANMTPAIYAVLVNCWK